MDTLREHEDSGLMEFCPKCGHRLIREPRNVTNGFIVMRCPSCGCKEQMSAKRLESEARATPAPLPDMPLSKRRRYYPSYMSPGEYFRDELRQMYMVEGITRKHSRAEGEDKAHENLSMLLQVLESIVEDLKQIVKTLKE